MPKKKIARSAVSGRFVKKSYAKKHPHTTEIERVRIGVKGGGTGHTGPKRGAGHTGPHLR